MVITPYSGMPPNAFGKPAEGVDVVVLNPETGKECVRPVFDVRRASSSTPPRPSARSSAATGGVVRGLLQQPRSNAERGRNGWYWSGDLGYRDQAARSASRAAGRLAPRRRRELRRRTHRARPRAVNARRRGVYAVPEDRRSGDGRDRCAGHSIPTRSQRSSRATRLGTKWSPRFVRVIDRWPWTATKKVDVKALRARAVGE